MKKIEIFGNYLIMIVVSISIVIGFEWYKNNYTVDKNKNKVFVFSAKEIIENKKLNIKKAVLNDGNVKEQEDNLILTIQTIDKALKEISVKLQKPIFLKESIVSGNTHELTPLIKQKLKDKGLL